MPQDSASQSMPPQRILLVDDDPFVREAVEMLLKYDGHIVEAVSNGEEALKVFEPEKYDVVITDFAMPGIHGDKLAQAMREIATKQPIVMLSAHGEFLRASGALSCIDALVEKPFRLDTLRSGIASALFSHSSPSPDADRLRHPQRGCRQAGESESQ